jgi:hypothetical protein
MNPRVTKVKCVDNHLLEVTFANDEIKLFDVAPYLNYPVFKVLQDESFFKKARVVLGTVAWNEAVDFDPDTLYLEGKTINIEGKSA